MRFVAKFVPLLLLLCLDMPRAGFAETGKSGEAKESTIRITGSQTMLSLTRRLTEWYEGRNKPVTFQVRGGAATEGFTAVIENKADIAQSTRKALDGEVWALRSRRWLEFVEIPVATEFAVIAVNAANPVRALSTFELRAILSGQVKNWKQAGGGDCPIHLIGRDGTSETRAD